jgi:hypothetical protein
MTSVYVGLLVAKGCTSLLQQAQASSGEKAAAPGTRLGNHVGDTVTAQGHSEVVMVFIVRSMPIRLLRHCTRREAVIILRLDI